MTALRKCGLLVLCCWALAIPAPADEIRLKDGKKLYGTIVAYEDNMFKVKTDFGFVLVEKDKIASIIPVSPAAPKTDAKSAAKKEPAPEAKPAVEPAMLPAKETDPATRAPAADAHKNKEKFVAKAPAAKNSAPPTAAAPKASAPPPAANPAFVKPGDSPVATSATEPPKAPEPPPNKEEVQGNTYINHAYGFRMYKAPSWTLIEDAREALPNAIVALGTQAESTLLVVGREETKDPLEKAAASVERRLEDAYTNYRRIEQKKLQAGGMPAMEYRYRGTAEGHDWSGTLVVVARGKDVFTVLGMTYADSDLIQIQENVIARAIASLDFSAH